MFKPLFKPKFKRPVIAFLMLFMLLSMGCKQTGTADATRYLVDTVQISQSLKQLDEQLLSTNGELASLQSVLTKTDYKKLQASAQGILQLRNALVQLVRQSGSLNSVLVNAEQVQLFTLKGGEDYARARAIIKKYWATLPIGTQLKLVSFDQQVTALNASLQSVMRNKDGADITENINQLVTVGKATAQVLRMSGVL